MCAVPSFTAGFGSFQLRRNYFNPRSFFVCVLASHCENNTNYIIHDLAGAIWKKHEKKKSVDVVVCDLRFVVTLVLRVRVRIL